MFAGKYFQALLILAAVCFTAVVSESSRMVNSKSTYVSPPIKGGPPACGGIITSGSGLVTYKEFANASPNERCVWIVRVPQAIAYSVTVTRMGNGASLAITGLGVYKAFQQNVLTSTGNVSLSNSNVLLITYSTPANVNNTKGFELQYFSTTANSNNGGGLVASDASSDFIFNSEIGYQRYPADPTAQTYTNLELSLFLMIFPGNLYIPNTDFRILYNRRTLEGPSCFDILQFYSFDGVKWSLEGDLCGDTEVAYFPSSDLILVVFESDVSVTGSGFDLSYSMCF